MTDVRVLSTDSRCDHCGKPEAFNVLCPECEQLACNECGRVECVCIRSQGKRVMTDEEDVLLASRRPAPLPRPSARRVVMQHPNPTEEIEWWKTWRAALQACINLTPPDVLTDSDHDEADNLLQRHTAPGRRQIYAMMSAHNIARTAHGFTPETYTGPR